MVLNLGAPSLLGFQDLKSRSSFQLKPQLKPKARFQFGTQITKHTKTKKNRGNELKPLSVNLISERVLGGTLNQFRCWVHQNSFI